MGAVVERTVSDGRYGFAECDGDHIGRIGCGGGEEYARWDPGHGIAEDHSDSLAGGSRLQEGVPSVGHVVAGLCIEPDLIQCGATCERVASDVVHVLGDGEGCQRGTVEERLVTDALEGVGELDAAERCAVAESIVSDGCDRFEINRDHIGCVGRIIGVEKIQRDTFHDISEGYSDAVSRDACTHEHLSVRGEVGAGACIEVDLGQEHTVCERPVADGGHAVRDGQRDDLR